MGELGEGDGGTLVNKVMDVAPDLGMSRFKGTHKFMTGLGEFL